MAPQDMDICGEVFPKRKKSATEFVPSTSYGYYWDSS